MAQKRERRRTTAPPPRPRGTRTAHGRHSPLRGSARQHCFLYFKNPFGLRLVVWWKQNRRLLVVSNFHVAGSATINPE